MHPRFLLRECPMRQSHHFESPEQGYRGIGAKRLNESYSWDSPIAQTEDRGASNIKPDMTRPNRYPQMRCCPSGRWHPSGGVDRTNAEVTGSSNSSGPTQCESYAALVAVSGQN